MTNPMPTHHIPAEPLCRDAALASGYTLLEATQSEAGILLTLLKLDGACAA